MPSTNGMLQRTYKRKPTSIQNARTLRKFIIDESEIRWQTEYANSNVCP